MGKSSMMGGCSIAILCGDTFENLNGKDIAIASKWGGRHHRLDRSGPLVTGNTTRIHGWEHLILMVGTIQCE